MSYNLQVFNRKDTKTCRYLKANRTLICWLLSRKTSFKGRLYKLSEIIRTIENDPNIAIEFIFYSNSKRLKQELPLILYFMNLYFTRNEREFLHELRQYVMNYPNSKKTVIDLWNKNEEVNEKLRYSVKEHFRWCVLNDIRMTPTYLLNGRFVDGHYTLEEIKRIAINM